MITLKLLVYGKLSRPIVVDWPAVPRVGDIVTSDVWGEKADPQVVTAVYWRQDGIFLMLGPNPEEPE